MSRVVSVSISDELYERLQKVKARFNVSHECQRAIREKIEMYDEETRENNRKRREFMSEKRKEIK